MKLNRQFLGYIAQAKNFIYYQLPVLPKTDLIKKYEKLARYLYDQIDQQMRPDQKETEQATLLLSEVLQRIKMECQEYVDHPDKFLLHLYKDIDVICFNLETSVNKKGFYTQRQEKDEWLNLALKESVMLLQNIQNKNATIDEPDAQYVVNKMIAHYDLCMRAIISYLASNENKRQFSDVMYIEDLFIRCINLYVYQWSKHDETYSKLKSYREQINAYIKDCVFDNKEIVAIMNSEDF